MKVTVSLRKFIGLIAYPPGTIYTCASDIDPAEMWGGEWEKLTGTFLWAADEARPLGSVGGEVEHVLALDEMPTHNGHVQPGTGNWNGRYLNEANTASYGSSPRGWDNLGAEAFPASNNRGEDQPHNNMPPYLSVNMWKRLTAFSSGGGVHHNPLKSLFQRRCLLWHCL